MGQLSEQAYRVLIIINASLAAAQLEITFWSRFRSCLALPFPLSPALTKSTSPSLFFSRSSHCRLSPFPSSSIALRCVLRAQVFATRAQSAAEGWRLRWLLRGRGKIKSDSNVRLARDKQKGGKKPKGTTSKRNETNRESKQREWEKRKVQIAIWLVENFCTSFSSFWLHIWMDSGCCVCVCASRPRLRALYLLHLPFPAPSLTDWPFQASQLPLIFNTKAKS